MSTKPSFGSNGWKVENWPSFACLCHMNYLVISWLGTGTHIIIHGKIVAMAAASLSASAMVIKILN